MTRRVSLVVQHMENIASAALEEYQDLIKDYAHRRHGIYALYRRNNLYYVGLASNLRNRLRQHLKDRHRRLWDRFSIYLTGGDQHMKELESLVLRIVATKGNKMRGKFARSENIGKRFQRDIVAQARQHVRDILGQGPRLTADARRKGRRRDSAKLTLAGAFPHTITIRKRFKGKLYRARLRSDGRIRYKGKLYDSPSHPASRITRRGVNGWNFWTYEARPRQWVPLQRLRR